MINTVFFVDEGFVRCACRYYVCPSVAAAPVTVLAIEFFMEKVGILISPPRAFFLIMRTVLAVFIANVFVRVPRFIRVFLFSNRFSRFNGCERSRLSNIGPPPVVCLEDISRRVCVNFSLASSFQVKAGIVWVGMDLTNAMVVDVTDNNAITRSPFIMV